MRCWRSASEAGLDVGAIEFVHKQLVAERDKGRGVLLHLLRPGRKFSISVTAYLVLCGGRIVGDLPRTVRSPHHSWGC